MGVIPETGTYYARRFTSREQLVCMIQDYTVYYNFRRLQRGLGVRTTMEVYDWQTGCIETLV